MKNAVRIFVALLLLIIVFKSEAQSRRIDIDTLQTYSDKILANYRIYSDSILKEEGQAYLYPDTTKISRSKWLPRFITKQCFVDRAVLHGIVTCFSESGKYRVGKYDNGQKITMNYYNPSNNEITYSEFYGNNLRIDYDPEQGTKYLFHGKKKVKD
ncbi:MAG: hypothetical protein KF900_02790 [Bacteroidetes bacterium]|nr:hypothetical protein [Bacteroidota bacterium]